MDDDSFKIAIIDDYNGYFFKNKKEYVMNILNLYENKDKYKTMSKQAINSAKQFSIEYYGKKILYLSNQGKLRRILQLFFYNFTENFVPIETVVSKALYFFD